MTADADRGRAPDQPVLDQPAPDQPALDQTASDQPALDQTASNQPALDQPASDQPASDQPVLDQTERVILRSAEEQGGPSHRGDVIIVGDTTGELTAAALARTEEHEGARVWSWNVSHGGSAALAGRFAAQCASGRLRVSGGEQPLALEEFLVEAEAGLVLMRLPKALAALDDLARRLAAHARATGAEDLTVIAGGRVKHMTRSQSQALAASFSEVRASRGIGKSRALIAAGPRPEAPAPRPATGVAQLSVRGARQELGLHGIGGVFSGARADAGSVLLPGALDRSVAAGDVAAGSAIDLGCGNGLLTAYLAAALPEAQVLGSDDDAEAVLSTRNTLEASGLGRDSVRVTWDRSLAREAAGSADLVLLNPPFHDGTVIDATLVQDLLDAAARVLRPGGQLWFVHNSHLRYRAEIETRIGPARQQARDRRFTVLSAVRD